MNYYPFGMLEPGRRYSASSAYRFGYNGKEQDSILGGGVGIDYNYGARMLDVRLGRFNSVDPITSKYPFLTPYQCASNRPIDGIDLDGLEFFKTDNTDYSISYKPVLKAPSFIDGAENTIHNTLAFVWNGTLGPLMTAGKNINNYFAGGYKNADPNPDPVYEFESYANDIYRYTTHTPAKQQLKDLGNAATDLHSYEIIPSLLIAHTLATPKVLIASSADIIGARTNLATSFYEQVGYSGERLASHLKYVDVTKPVFTKTLEEGTQLIQFRLKGASGIGDYYALPGTTPEQIGLKSSDVAATYNVTVNKPTKGLLTTHVENAPSYYDATQTSQGGGTQIFSPTLKDNATITPQQ